MTRNEHLIVIAMEECAEVAQRISKAGRFGMSQIQQDADDKPEENPGRLSNRARIVDELNDLMAILEMLGISMLDIDGRKMYAKREKVERYLKRSADCGTLRPDAGSGTASAKEVERILGFDPSKHHNALACPYCNPNRLTLAAQPPADSVAAIQDHRAASPALADAPRDGWLPIETAPKDGTWVMLYVRWQDKRDIIGCGQWTLDGEGRRVWFWPWSNQPTHWQPLPAPPGADAPRQGKGE